MVVSAIGVENPVVCVVAAYAGLCSKICLLMPLKC